MDSSKTYAPLQFFKKTHDDWHGSYRCKDAHNGQRGFDMVECLAYPCTTGITRISLYGNDDFWLSCTYDNPVEGFHDLQCLLSIEFVDFANLQNLKFIPK